MAPVLVAARRRGRRARRPDCSSSVRRTRRRVSSCVLVHADEAEEHLAGGRAAARRRARVDRFGAPPDGAGQTARFVEGGERDRRWLVRCRRTARPSCAGRAGARPVRRSASAVIRSTSAGSTSTPTPAAGRRTASASSAAVIAPRATVRPFDGVAEPGVAERPVEVVGPQRDDEAHDGVGLRRRCPRASGRRPGVRSSSTVWVNSSSNWSITTTTARCLAARRRRTTSSSARAWRAQLVDDVGQRGRGDAVQRRGQPLERIVARVPSR